MNGSTSASAYRPDIDGLRAIAVISVVLFHAFPKTWRAGFIGVDTFFVISGFLISSILLSSLENHSFRFIDFYSRRIKRIFPALIVVLTAGYFLGYQYLLANELKQLGQHMVAAAGFVSNFVLWNEAGYFDNSAESKPLLHLWSLGIEEQFYIFWPFLLWLIHRFKFKKATIVAILGIIAFSFYSNMKMTKLDASGAFYSPQTRIWELMFGALLAWIKINRPYWIKTRSVRSHFLSILGVAIFVWASLLINKSLAFPSWRALLPVVSATLLIAAGPAGLFNRVLATPLLVSIGLISFPLYLWHWPILSFARIIEGQTPSFLIRTLAVILSILLGSMTYLFIEKPIRKGRIPRYFVSSLVGVMMMVAGIGYYTYKGEGFVNRFVKLGPERHRLILTIARAWQARGYPGPPGFMIDEKLKFQRLGKNENSSVLFVGDSHSIQYTNTVASIYSKFPDGTSVLPSALFTWWNFPVDLDAKVLKESRIKKVVFAYFWALQYGSLGVHEEVRCCGDGKNGSLGFRRFPHRSPDEILEADARFTATIKKLQQNHVEVYIVLDTPFGEELDPQAMLDRNWGGFTVSYPPVLSKSQALTRAEPIRSHIIQIAQDTGAKLIDPILTLCGKETCPAFDENGELVFMDYDHMSYLSVKDHVHYLDNIFLQNERHK